MFPETAWQSFGWFPPHLTWHVLQVNPLVGSALEAHAKLQQPIMLPRQAGLHVGGPGQCAGVSAFAFQGTNAHAIVAAPRATQIEEQKPSLLFVRRRMWFTSCRAHRMLHTAVSIGGKCPQLTAALH